MRYERVLIWRVLMDAELRHILLMKCAYSDFERENTAAGDFAVPASTCLSE